MGVPKYRVFTDASVWDRLSGSAIKISSILVATVRNHSSEVKKSRSASHNPLEHYGSLDLRCWHFRLSLPLRHRCLPISFTFLSKSLGAFDRQQPHPSSTNNDADIAPLFTVRACIFLPVRKLGGSLSCVGSRTHQLFFLRLPFWFLLVPDCHLPTYDSPDRPWDRLC